ncbi:MAG TPA: hypothetical protein VJ761_07495 [Ktedonobacteraceae bacterium]|nr:hypothetical protein [Ktedonobacteraceae bacterium]
MVQVPGTRYDTQNLGDQQVITNLIVQEQLPDARLQPFVTDLANAYQHWTDYERGLFTAVFLSWVRRSDAGQVYTLASGRGQGQQGVWCMGRVIVNNQPYGIATDPVRAQYSNQEAARQSPYAAPEEADAAEVEVSFNDAEVLVLTALSNILTEQDWQTMQHLRVMLTGSQGPCNVCKLRIQQLISELNRIAYTQRPDLRATRPRPQQLPLIFEVNYTTRYQPNANQGGLPTTYGYQNAATILVAPTEQPPVRYEFWRRTFQLLLGASNQVNFQNL